MLLLLGVELAERIVQPVIIRHEQNIITPTVPPRVVLAELIVAGGHVGNESNRVDEGKESDSLPSHLLAVHVNVELSRVEVDDRGEFICHKVVEDVRNVDLSACGQRGSRTSTMDPLRHSVKMPKPYD